MQVSVEGTVEEIIYENEMNGYCVLELETPEENIVVVGYLPFINEGDYVKVLGTWVTHPDYGKQLKADNYEKRLPHTKEALIKYLCSGVIKGIGPVTASRVVERFGENSVDIIKNEPHRLSEIRGISQEKAMEISTAFTEQEALGNVVMFFQEYGISPAFSAKIYKTFGEDTISMIKNNPYLLSEKVYGIGFKTADTIAMKIGFELASESRVMSGIKYVLTMASMEGHTYLSYEMLVFESEKLLNVNEQSVENAVIALMIDNKIHREKSDDYDRIYLKKLYMAELEVARKLNQMNTMNTRVFCISDVNFDKVQKEEEIILADMQKVAIEESLQNGVVVITGGPGTGKTTIIKTIIKLLDDYKIALAAPTGRAAKRMSEATGIEAKTIHRLLEIGYSADGEEPTFARNEDNPLEADVVIIDEMSMVDILLMNNLLRAMPFGSRLIMVGDIDQLPSVGPGNVLKDIINSGAIKTIRLTEVFRQAEESMIIMNAHAINKGIFPSLNEKDKDFFFVKRQTNEEIINTIVDLCTRRLPVNMDFDPIRHIQVLTPTRKIGVGVLQLNQKLQEALNPKASYKKEKAGINCTFREGDRVMQTKNNYNLRWKKADGSDILGNGVFNGDMGVITEINTEEQFVEVLYDDDRLASYDFSVLDELELSYAITVHKSQGSEFPVVVMPIFQAPPQLLSRNILYTAITRAKSLVVLTGSVDNLKQMVINQRETNRFSGLEEKISRISNDNFM